MLGAMALTPKQELFARLCVELVNQSAAYRRAYNVSPDAKWTTVSVEASRLAADPEVAARIRSLQDEAAARSAVPTLAARIQELREIESANPNDIIGMRWVNCRHCRGFDHGYQFVDEIEYAKAVDTAIALKQAHPSMEGGFGFNATLDPVPDCPRCWGIGEQRPFVADTTKLTGAARRLYKGIKIKGNGDVEVLLHDQMHARDMLNRIMGAYKDGAAQGALTPPSSGAAEVKAADTAEERQRRYLRLVSG
jgi:phage terminase small subunit